MLEKSFGEKLKDVKYIDRIGGYAVIFDEDNKVAVVKTKLGYFLLGGGIEDGESYEECIKRECLEEAGLEVEVNKFICKGDKFIWSPVINDYLHATGYFYLVDIIKQEVEPIEEDHELLWLEVEECYKKLYLEHQAWAVGQGLLVKMLNL